MTARQEIGEIANHVPQVVAEWSPFHARLKSEDVVRKLWDGDPRIAILAEGPQGLRIMVWTLRDEEHLLVAERIVQVFREAGAG